MYTSTSISTEINYCFLEADRCTGNGGEKTDWAMVGKGLATFSGGLISTVGGVAAISSGVGVGLGVAGVVFGIPTMGLGLAQAIEGFQGGNQTYPSGVAEAVDISFGGDGTVGQLIDIGIGGAPKNTLDFTFDLYQIGNSNIGQSILNPRPSDNTNNFNFIPIYTQPIDNTRVIITY